MTEAEKPLEAATLRSRQVVWAALLLGLLALVLALVFLGYAEREIRAHQLTAAETQARVLEDQSAAVVSATDLILRSLATVLMQDGPTDAAALRAVLSDGLRGRPYLRSLSLVDAQGRVQASSNPDNAGASVPAAWLQAPAAQFGATRLGALASGRDLNELGRVPLAETRWLALPLLAPLPGPDGNGWLVALINPDHFATQFERMLDGTGLRALLLGLDGSFIVGTSGVEIAPGSSMAALPAFSEHLPGLESASGIGPGSDGRPALGAFRVTRQWPLVVLVEQPHQAWPPALQDIARWTLAFLLVSWAVLGAATWGVRRALAQDERLSLALGVAHAATKASESRKLAILQSSLDAIVTVDAQGRVVEFNTAAERMFGHAAERALGQPMHELIVPHHHRQAHQAGMARYQSTGVAHVLNRRVEVEALRADGSLFPVELTIVPVKTAAGEMFTATLRDITEQRRIDQALRESEERARAIFEQAAVGMLQQGVDRRFLRVNQALCDLLGYTQAEFLALAADELIHPDDVATGLEGMRALFDGRLSSFAQEKRYRRKDGRHVWVRLTASVARDQQGRALYMIGIVEDIDSRLQAEAALRESQAILDKVGRIAGVGGWQLDAATGIVSSTEQSCHIHEIALGTQGTLAQTLAFYAPEARPVIQQAVERALASGEGFDLELPFVTARGRSIWVRVVGAAERDAGRVVRLVGALQDITAQRLAQAELTAAREREVQIGARIQQSLLVTTPPADLGGLQLSSFSQASQGIDGDFVEVIRLGTHCVDIIAGDVMGKGLAAAMMGAATKLQFSRSIAELVLAGGAPGKVPEPAAVVAAVHRAMTPALQALEAFVTLCYLRLDTQHGTVTWVGCGHEETLHIGRGAAAALANQHPPLGVLDAADYTQDERALAAGDTLFLCSDGVTDAVLGDGSRVGRQRADAAVLRRASRHDTPAAVLHALRTDLLPPGVTMQDDLTMVVVQWPDAAQQMQRIELPAQLASIRPLRDFVAAQTQGIGVDEAAAGLLGLACVEAFTNVVRHASGRLEGAPVEVVARRGDGALVLDLVYLGEAFAPQADLPETELGLYPEGGFGLQIIERACDDVAYLHDAGVNTVRLLKRLG